MTVFWDVALCSLEGAGDEGSKHLENVGKFLTDYKAQHPRRDRDLHTRRRENLKSHRDVLCFLCGKN
jgi:hypothetical protein